MSGVPCLSSNTAYRYLGTLYASATNTTCDTQAERYIWNNNNRVTRSLYATITTTSWSDSADAYGPPNSNTTLGQGRVGFIIGLQETPVSASYSGRGSGSTTTFGDFVCVFALGLDSTTTVASGGTIGVIYPMSTINITGTGFYQGLPAIGYHYLQELELGGASSGTCTFYGNGSNQGLLGQISN